MAKTPNRDPEAQAVEDAIPEDQPRAIVPSTGPVGSDSWNPTLLKARFPRDLTDPKKLVEFLTVCRVTNLNPFLQEIVPIHGRLYITEIGWGRLIDERAPGELVRDEVTLAAPEDYERFGLSEEYGWLAVATIGRFMPSTGQTRIVTDYSFLSQADVKGSSMSVIKAEPWRQCMKTARVRALRKAFPEVLYKALEGTGVNQDLLPPDLSLDDGLTTMLDEGQRKEDEAAQKVKFWKKANAQGLRSGSAKLIAWLETEYPDTIRPDADPKKFKLPEWMASVPVTWAELNAAIDRLLEE